MTPVNEVIATSERLAEKVQASAPLTEIEGLCRDLENSCKRLERDCGNS